jgi:hypothetical protein
VKDQRRLEIPVATVRGRSPAGDPRELTGLLPDCVPQRVDLPRANRGITGLAPSAQLLPVIEASSLFSASIFRTDWVGAGSSASGFACDWGLRWLGRSLGAGDNSARPRRALLYLGARPILRR